MAEEYDDEKPKPGRPSNEGKLAAIHQEAVEEFDAIESAVREEREQCLDDRRFYSIAGAQWEGSLGEQFENKPQLEVNKVHLAVIRIINEYRNNRIDVVFTPKDGAQNDELADACASLYRADEQDSTAEEAYDNAFEEAVGGGFGAWRLRACYEDEYSDDSERQRIQMEPIFDADSSVFFDLNAKRQDKSDARCCFVLTSMTRAEYRRMYDDDPASWPKSINRTEFDWTPEDAVIVAEYYRVEDKPDWLVNFLGLNDEEESHLKSELDEDEELAATLDATGFREVSRKKIKRRKVRKFLMNGSRIIEDCGTIAGTQIPIVPVYGKRWFIDNIERCQGHVRLARDAQRIKNMQLSKLAEISALSTIEKPIFTPKQILAHGQLWADDNIKNYPYLMVDSVMDAAGAEALTGPVGYTKVPTVPPAMAALLQLTDQDIEQMLGNPNQAEKMISHVPGKTFEALAQRIDGNSFIYISNMGKAIRRCGQIWLSMARELYTEAKRKMKGVGARGNLTQIELQKPMIGPDDAPTMANDLTRAAFDVAVNIGPSSVSKREAAVRTITSMLAVTQDPATQAVLSNFALMNMEGEAIDDIRKWSRQQLVKSGVVKPTDEEAQQLAAEAQAAQPTPQDKYLEAAAAQAQARAAQAEADTQLTAAQIDKTKADTIETLAGIDLERQKAGVAAAESLHGMLNAPAQPTPEQPSGLGSS